MEAANRNSDCLPTSVLQCLSNLLWQEAVQCQPIVSEKHDGTRHACQSRHYAPNRAWGQHAHGRLSLLLKSRREWWRMAGGRFANPLSLQFC